MRLNEKIYFEKARQNGIEPFVLSYGEKTGISVLVYNGEIEKQLIGESQSISGRGIVNGKVGAFGTDAIDKDTPDFMMNSIVEAARFGKELSPDTFYRGGKKYGRVQSKEKAFVKATLKELREADLSLYERVKAKDERLTTIEVSISMKEGKFKKSNSYGVSKAETKKSYTCGISVVATDESDEPRSGYSGFESFISLEDLASKAEKYIDRAVHSAVDFFKTGPIPSKSYKAILSPDCFSSLFEFCLSHFNAKSVQKHLSVYEGKVGEEIFSPCFTVKHTPFVLSSSSLSFDSDIYPTQNFTLIDKGVLKTYFYSVETANNEGIESNGCSSGDGNGEPTILTVSKGRSSLEGLFRRMKNGIYITSISGLNSGINGQTLDFSLPCQGYLIKDGKIEKAVSMIVCAGNLKELFHGALALADDVEDCGGIFTPSVLFKSLSISGQ